MSDDLPYRLTVFATVLGVQIGAVVAVYPALRAARHIRAISLGLASAIVLGAPLLIPPEARPLRLLAAIHAVTLVIKLFDLHRGAARGCFPLLPGLIAFLPNIFCLVHRKLGDAPRRPAREHLRRIAAGGAAVVAAVALFAVTFRVDWTHYPFAAEHSAKVVTFFLVIVPLTVVAGAAWGLLGGRGIEFMDNPFAARTPADFWRRYNCPVHQFLWEDVYLPAGGRRHPVRGALLVFVVSAAVHEYVFAVPAGAVRGHQTAFFVLQGVAVAATLRLKPRGAFATAAMVATTFLFNLATAVLFFASVDAVLPFYRNEVPVW